MSSFGHAVRPVVENEHAAVAKPRRRPLRTAQQRRLGVDLGHQRARRQRRGLNHAGEGRPSRGRVKQMVRRAPVGIKPAAPADPARGDSGVRQLKRVQRAVVEGALHRDRAAHGRRAANRQIAGAVDRKCLLLGQRMREHVGKQTLGHATAVKAHARRPPNRRCAEVHLDLAPASRSRPGWTARWCLRQRLGKRQRREQI